MNDSTPLPVTDDIAVFRLSGDFRFGQVVDRVAEAVERAAASGQTRLLIDITDATGFAPPSLADRHAMVRRLAEAARGFVRGAMVVRPAFIDPQKFGVVAAANFGLVSNVFQREDEAMAWLRSLP
ncbi:STAS/SEC14 domain-containing protein [Arenimonas sp.]|uniref:STAS/SEC14 domain-containing protein n=1 Tax=Arenimonas sp. TaxID=1872635 RepID=UPI0039E389A1